MAQCNFAKKVTSNNEPVIEATDVMTGDKNQSRYLYYQLKMSMLKAKGIDIIVSFLMESGIRMILNDIRKALDRGASVRILTGNYLGITQPSALYLIKKEFGSRIDLRFYNDKARSFHPKAYIFHYENASEIYIGSSNISKSALTSGIEWNYRFSSKTDGKNFQLFYETFEDLFFHHSIAIDNEELIYKHYMKYRSKRALDFCCSRQHAEEMAKEFCNRGIASAAVYSNADGEYSEDREKAIEKLKNQEVKVIFYVDVFNEGLLSQTV